MARKHERRTAIYFAKQAYDLWLHNGIKAKGFQHCPQTIQGDTVPADASYLFVRDDWAVVMRTNGATIAAFCLNGQGI